MPTKTINQLFLERLAPPKTGRVEYWDKHQPGLCLRVSASGAKSWAVMYRVKGNGAKVRETLGTLAEIPNVADARTRARASLDKARAGVNPVEERRAIAEVMASNTVAAAVKRYLTQCKRDLRPNTVAGYRQLFDHDVLPRWGTRPVAEITKGDVLELLNDKAACRERKRKGQTEGAVVQANRLLTRLRTFFGWCIANDLVTADPTVGVHKPAKETPRDRVLTDDELRAFWQATETLLANRKDAVDFGSLFRLLLLTAQRENEVAGMRWSEVNLEARTWTIPGARTKNSKPHIVHLSALALEVLERVRPGDDEGQQAERADDQDLLFSGTGKTPASGFSRAKARLDGAMAGPLGAGPEAWVLHDLRRTATTGMARLGIAPHVADRVLNHTAGTIRGVAAIYNRFEYLDERKVALEAWGRFVETLVRPAESNVVQLRAEATAS
jgi:integrase